MRLRSLLVPASVVAALGVAGGVALVRRPERAESTAAATSATASSVPVAAAVAAGPSKGPGFYGPELSNFTAYIPAQCYATTREQPGGQVRNGCFVCHQEPRAPNYTDDSEVQRELSFARYATRNRWSHLTSPPAPAVLPDAELLALVRTSNYFAADGTLTLASRLREAPPPWDSDGDGKWAGFVPDCWFRVNDAGFDVDANGTPSGWRAYAYTPLPGMFFPTNGSEGDAFIRLPEAYRLDAAGAPDDAIYRVNLAIVEAYVKRVAVPIPKSDERALGSDLNGDGVLGTAERVAFVWPPKPGRPFHYVGKAAELAPEKDGWPVAGLYPRGTELLHSVRYLDVVDGTARMAARMKELRYMRKGKWLNYGQLEQNAEAEGREKFQSPDKLKRVFGDRERGVSTGSGWVMQAFVEDGDGALRPQNFEETTACIGCHGGVGAATDSTFSFARKLASGTFRDGWYHPSEPGAPAVHEPKRADGSGEYAHYLREVGGGDDFRSNDEVRAKFFRPDGSLLPERVSALSRDISLLVRPSAERALALDRAYLGVVRAQHFELGRDVVVGGPPQIQLTVEQNAATGIETPVLPAWKSVGLAER